MTSNNEYDYAIKTLIIGDSGVGKSSIMNQFTESKYSDSYQCTIGVDYKTVYVNIQDKLIKFLIWDTAGQERFKSITKIYYRGAHVIIFVYDITDIISFENIPKWIKETEQIAPESCIKILVGNKCDVDEQISSSIYQTNKKREISKEDALQMVKKYEFVGYYETSAKINKGIDNFFLEIGNYYVKNDYYNKFISSNPKTNDSVKLPNNFNIEKEISNKNYFSFKRCFCQ